VQRRQKWDSGLESGSGLVVDIIDINPAGTLADTETEQEGLVVGDELGPLVNCLLKMACFWGV